MSMVAIYLGSILGAEACDHKDSVCARVCMRALRYILMTKWTTRWSKGGYSYSSWLMLGSLWKERCIK